MLTLILADNDYAVLSYREKQLLREIVRKANVNRSQKRLPLVYEITDAVNALFDSDEVMTTVHELRDKQEHEQANISTISTMNLSKNQKLEKYEAYIRSKGDDPYDVLYGRDEAASEESSDLKARDAAEVVGGMDSVETIRAYISNESRVTVLRAAENRIEELGGQISAQSEAGGN